MYTSLGLCFSSFLGGGGGGVITGFVWLSETHNVEILIKHSNHEEETRSWRDADHELTKESYSDKLN